MLQKVHSFFVSNKLTDVYMSATLFERQRVTSCGKLLQAVDGFKLNFTVIVG